MDVEVENDADLPVEKSESVSSEHKLAALPATETESVPQQSSPSLLQCDDEALASAENENNMNVESEHNSIADRFFESANDADALTAAENDTDLPLDVERDGAAVPKISNDEMHVTEGSDVPQLSAEANTDNCETESTRDHSVLSSCSFMIIDVQDHEFSDEELQEAGKNAKDNCEPAVQSTFSKSSAEQHTLQQSPDSRQVTVEQEQKNDSATRVIRLNRNFRQQLPQRTPERPAKSGDSTPSERRPVRKPADGSQCPSNDASSERAKLTVVSRRDDAESSRPKQLKLDSSSGLLQASQKLAASKKSPDESKPRSRTGEVSAPKVKYKFSEGSSPAVTSSKSVPAESKEVKRQVSVSKDRKSLEVTHERVQLRDETERGGSAESDSLSKTQLEILELEMRARAIKAMIRAQEEVEQLESAKKKRRSSGVSDMAEVTEERLFVPEHSTPRSISVVRQHSSAPQSHSRGELRSLQSVVGRNIIKRAEFVARHQRHVAPEERFQQRKQFVEQRRLSQAALLASRRTVRLQSEARFRPMRYVVTTEPSARVVRLPSARFGVPLPFSRRPKQRRFELRGNLASSGNSRDDRRRVLMSSSHRSVRLSSSRPS